MHRVFRTACVVLLLAGCRPSGVPQVSISGEVTFDGRPVPAGTIYFEPTLEAGRDAPTGFAMIREGRYRTERGRGPGSGPYRARISGGDGRPIVQTMNLDPEGPPESALRFGNLLFDNHEVDVQLPTTDTTIDFDIPADAGAGANR